MLKRGSLNISIEVIVIIVIAMTLLGLGLGFVRSQFGQLTTLGTEVQEQVREQITAQLRSSGEKVSFPRDVQMGRRDDKVLTLGIQNTGGRPLNFMINLTWDLDNSDFDSNTLPGDFGLRWDRSCLSLSAADAEVYGIRAEAVANPGTYALRADIVQYANENCTGEQSIYVTKLSFITVG